MKNPIIAALRRLKKHTGLIVDKSIFRTKEEGRYNYYMPLTGKITLLKYQTLGIVMHELGHLLYDKSNLKNNPLVIKKFGRPPNLFCYLLKRFAVDWLNCDYDKNIYITPTASINPEEDFCECFAEITTGRHKKYSYPVEIRNKLRRVERVLRIIKESD